MKSIPTKQMALSNWSTSDFLKWFSLFFLVFQNSGAALVMRYVRSVPEHSQWHSQTGVIMQEVLKLVACLVVILSTSGFKGIKESFQNPTEVLKTIVPAVAYLIQNNLQYVATGHLQSATYSVLYQLKILSTAFLSVLLLGKELKFGQWIAIAILTSGCACVSLSQMGKKANNNSEGNFVIGLIAVLSATLCSGLAGVYFEKLLKQSKQSLWQRNLVLALYSIGAGLVTLYMGPDKDQVLQNGFFHGYTNVVWSSVANNAFGGLIIASVMKYADSILKNFACGFSIMMTVVSSYFLFGDEFTSMFAGGVMLVVYSVVLYGGAVRLPFSAVSAEDKKKEA